VAAMSAFGSREIPGDFLSSSSIPRGSLKTSEQAMPTVEIPKAVFKAETKLAEVFGDYGLTGSRGEARRLIKQGGVYINGERVSDVDAVLTSVDIQDGKVAIRIGKKKHYHLVMSE